jgi:hypothetical protein
MSDRVPDGAEPEEARGDDAIVTDFAAAVLRALTDMSARSLRSQADVAAALHAAQMPIDAPRLRAALRLLLANGCVTRPVPLSDGGLLLTVSRQAMPQLAAATEWLPLDGPDAATPPPGPTPPPLAANAPGAANAGG